MAYGYKQNGRSEKVASGRERSGFTFLSKEKSISFMYLSAPWESEDSHYSYNIGWAFLLILE